MRGRLIDRLVINAKPAGAKNTSFCSEKIIISLFCKRERGGGRKEIERISDVHEGNVFCLRIIALRTSHTQVVTHNSQRIGYAK